MTSYFEKLKDPRWQRQRLEILERDQFTCQRCGSTEKTLHVHHGYYVRDCDPWDYEEWTLHTVCCDCHAEITKMQENLKYGIGTIGPEDIDLFNEIIGEVVFMFLYRPECRHEEVPRIDALLAIAASGRRRYTRPVTEERTSTA